MIGRQVATRQEALSSTESKGSTGKAKLKSKGKGAGKTKREASSMEVDEQAHVGRCRFACPDAELSSHWDFLIKLEAREIWRSDSSRRRERCRQS